MKKTKKRHEKDTKKTKKFWKGKKKAKTYLF
jgi:hypothetical protein